MAFVGFFVLCGIGTLVAAVVMTRLLWSEEQRGGAVVVGSLMTILAFFCFASAWVWWEGPLF